MFEKYEKLLNEIEKISLESYELAEVLHGYCNNFDGQKISSDIIGKFFKEIREKQSNIIKLIDEKSTEIRYELYMK